MTMALQTVNGNTQALEEFEQFSETDSESIVLQEGELEELEDGSEADLESIAFEDVAESLLEYVEGAEEEGLERRRSRRRGAISKRVMKIIFGALKKLVKKIISNPRTRILLFNACKKGRKHVVRLLMPCLRRSFKPPFRFLVDAFAPIIIARVYPQICRLVARQAGMKAEEVEALPGLSEEVGAGSFF